MTASGDGASIPIGVYRGPGCGIEAIEAYESWLGLPAGSAVAYVLDFMMDRPADWAQFERGRLPAWTNASTPGADVSVWQGQLGGRTLMLGVPACVLGSTWETEQDANDAHWKALGTRLIELGFGDAVLRIAREFNGSWYPWQVREGEQAAYIAGYRHVVELLRGLPGARFTFMWNPHLGTGTLNRSGAESCYPGDCVVDVIGVDVYDGDWSGIYSQSFVRSLMRSYSRKERQQRAVWDNIMKQWDGLDGWRNLAEDHGKPLAYPEWGLRLWLDGGVYHGGGDNPLFISRMAAWMKETGAFMHAMWEDPGMGVSDPDDAPRRTIAVPQSRRAFLAAFGSR
jgi:hypothetical protein